MNCILCALPFLSQWMAGDSCIFCKYYSPTKDTKYSLLEDIENRYLWSGYTSRREFYPKHIAYINAWTGKHGIPTSELELSYEQQLLKVSDWTRPYWH